MNEQIRISVGKTFQGEKEESFSSRNIPENGEACPSEEEKVAEEWRQVIGYEGLYDVSNMGRVRSYRQPGRSPLLVIPRILKGTNSEGFSSVRIGNKPTRISRLVAKHFLGMEEKRTNEVVHINGLNDDDRLSNLKVVSSDGMYQKKEYAIWSAMLARCFNIRNKRFSRYGGRGISVCDKWRLFKNFWNDMGPAGEGLSIERIDNNGNYEPGNCRWGHQNRSGQ